jgi:hypothetical protein
LRVHDFATGQFVFRLHISFNLLDDLRAAGEFGESLIGQSGIVSGHGIALYDVGIEEPLASLEAVRYF